MKRRPTVIVLAAGLGSRFKGSVHKLAQPLDGSTVLGSTLAHVIESQLPMVVVTTESLAGEASRVVASRDIVALPADPRRGMAESLVAGLVARPDAAGWLVLPGDMPRVRASSLQAVAAALEQHPVAYAQYRGRRGHPVGFSAELYSELLALKGDEGARRVVARFPSFGVEVDDPGVLVDVDTVDDLAAVRRVAPAHKPAAGRPL